ncbi:unnamed protein product [Durusdinium trenchii]|uniref:FAD-dependent oxidoreductase domain-containing protein 1 n=1 Tax=Durusdinium trenchii TaxID=1381693 RepID=A0ABP0PNA9_9DINO
MRRRGGAAVRVTLVEPRAPLQATSQFSTECYRDFFVDTALVPFMSRSVSLLEELAETDDAINLNRRGYCFFAGSDAGTKALERFGVQASSFGAGPLRRHDGSAGRGLAEYERSCQGTPLRKRVSRKTGRFGSWEPTGVHHEWTTSVAVRYQAFFCPAGSGCHDPHPNLVVNLEYGTLDAERRRRSPANGFRGPTGLDLVYGPELIQEIYPFVTSKAQVMLHARRCGWLDAQALGRAMLTASGGQVLRGEVVGFDTHQGAVTAVQVQQNDGVAVSLKCDAFVNAAGAWMERVNKLLEAPPLPLKNEVHAKVILNDVQGVIPQTAPFMVWRDQVDLDWEEDMKEFLLELDDTATGGMVNSASWLAKQPGGQHLRPCGNGRVLLLWEHLHRHVPVPEDPEMPISDFLEMYPELCVRGLKEMVPGLGGYVEGLGKDTSVDGGYYTVMPDGRPLVSPHGASNAYVCGGMGTYGLMGSPAAGELLAMHLLQEPLPSYADACLWPRRSVPEEEVIDLLDESS